MTDQSQLTPELARANLEQYQQWLADYQKMTQQLPSVQQQISFLNGYLERVTQEAAIVIPNAPPSASNGEGLVTEMQGSQVTP